MHSENQLNNVVDRMQYLKITVVLGLISFECLISIKYRSFTSSRLNDKNYSKPFVILNLE